MTSSPAVGSGTQPRAAREPGRALTRTRGRGGHRHGQHGPGEAPGAGGTGSGLERGVHGTVSGERGGGDGQGGLRGGGAGGGAGREEGGPGRKPAAGNAQTPHRARGRRSLGETPHGARGVPQPRGARRPVTAAVSPSAPQSVPGAGPGGEWSGSYAECGWPCPETPA